MLIINNIHSLCALAIPFPIVDPVAIKVFGFEIYWYAISYVIGIICGMFIINRLNTRAQFQVLGARASSEDLSIYIMLGIILGGRLGYVLFYNPLHYLSNPFDILMIRNGGMSFHGALIGVVVGVVIFCQIKNVPFFKVTDMLSIACTPGIFFGRIGNFVNGELYGKITDVPWGIIFPNAGMIPRHPSQIYEAILEGPILFLLLFLKLRGNKRPGDISCNFLIYYGIIRCFIEFFRESEFILWYATTGQVLSLCMIACGIIGKKYKSINNDQNNY